jgi:hypothetical protein
MGERGEVEEREGEGRLLEVWLTWEGVWVLLLDFMKAWPVLLESYERDRTS